MSKKMGLECKIWLCGLLCLHLAAAMAGEGGQIQWRSYAADGASSRFLPLMQINATNVDNLAEAWVWDSPDNTLAQDYQAQGLTLWPNAFEGTPLMVDGRLYVVTGLSQVVAIDPRTGKTLWVHDPKSYLSADGSGLAYPPNLGLIERGVAYWEQGKVKRLFLATGAANLIALDPSNGAPVADFGVGGVVDLKTQLRRPAPQPFYGVTSAPLICNNVIIVGSQTLDFPLQPQMPVGDVRGFSPLTGELLWTFHTVPQDGEPGAETWDEQGRANTGATNVWAPMSCDEKTGMAYLPVSTPANDFYGGNRRGGNLYADSLVALDAQSGRLKWHFQLVHHGLWDYDTPAAPNLIDLHVRGRLVKAVAQVTKQGFVYVFDRRTGKPVWPIIERPVLQSSVPGEQSAPTQPVPTRPAPFERQGLSTADLIDFTPELHQEALATVAPYVYGPLFTPPVLDQSAQGGPRGTISMPGSNGAVAWAGAAVNPETGVLYVPSISRPTTTVLAPFSSAGLAGSSNPLRLADGLPIVKPPYGRLTAIDLNTGEHLWMQPLGEGPVSHPALKNLGLKKLGWDRRSWIIATGSLLWGVQEGIVGRASVQVSQLTSLLNITSDAAYLWAFDPRTGATLLQLPIRLGNASGSPMTYEINHRQFIVVPVGGAGSPAHLVAYSLR